MTKKILAVIALVAALCLAGLAGCSDGKMVASLEEGTVSCTGNTITITLDENPSTGYTWTCDIQDEGLALVSDDYSTSSSDKNLDGAGGTRTYVVTASGKTKADIKLTYARSWETSDYDLHYTVSVETNNSGTVTVLSADSTK